MLKLSESEYPNVVQIEVDGNVMDIDAEKSEAFIKEHYGDDAELNALIYIKKLEGVRPGGVLRGIPVDAKHWDQFNKFAVVADDDILKSLGSLTDMLPGISVESFDKTEIDDAWRWLAA
ncbi:STAS/SEC14 domain-containing protein [Lacicoccus alkaliphilus]|uniref:SpoIIAA-like n=1 Tax=Lacicoccus alkaliphilus DSM 16010 TaxID=1123231 RepID=A0A1M7GG92_9BACL|nr:STAS/SEC14 domain-containing protein [Salinicoccus alkaliphilus]SHM14889.1 SpoIIAA-like [Salinicoccus alkaliphilus DSM 16010]